MLAVAAAPAAVAVSNRTSGTRSKGGGSGGGGSCAVRPLRRGATSWGSRRLTPLRCAAAVTPVEERDEDQEEPEPEEVTWSSTAENRKRVLALTGLSADSADQAGLMRRVGAAAVISAAALFGGASATHATALKVQQASTVTAAYTSSASAAPVASSVVADGARDLGMLLAAVDDDNVSEGEKEGRERARKLAEVRAIKAKRQEKLNTRKGLPPKEDPAAKELTPAEEKKAARLKSVREKAFNEEKAKAFKEEEAAREEAAKLEEAAREKAAKARVEAAKAREEAAKAREEAGLDAEPDVPELEEVEEEIPERDVRPKYTVEEHNSRLKQLISRTNFTQNNDPIYQEQTKGFFDSCIEKVTGKAQGPRFTRNVNLRYLRDPFCAMGTSFSPTECAYTGFYHLCETGRVNRVEYMSNMNSVKFYLNDTSEVFFSNLPYDPTLYTMLVDREINIAIASHGLFMKGVTLFFNILSPAVVMLFAFKMWMSVEDDQRMEGEGNQQTSTGSSKRYNCQPSTKNTMSDIAGIDIVREEMNELISYLRDYEKYSAAGATIPAGVLLCGPPGTGKTLLATCLAGEAGVPFFSTTGTEFMEMFVGVGAARIRNLFKQAREVKPCIIFIDEFDSVAVRRKDAASMDISGNDEQVATINQLLSELDGFGLNSGVMVFAATNRPQVIDPALIRPGRFDRIIEMPLPHRRARMEIIDLHSGYREFKNLIDPDIDVELIARQAAGFTGADLENLVRQSAFKHVDPGGFNRVEGEPTRIANTDTFLEVIDQIRSLAYNRSTGSSTGSSDDATENFMIQQMSPYVRDTITTYFAAQTLVASMMPSYDDIAKVKIFDHGMETGHIYYVPEEVGAEGSAQIKRRAWYEAKMCVLVSGQMAERYLYGPDGISQFGVVDMREASAMACEMVMMHGWSEIGPMAILKDSSTEEMYLKKNVKAPSMGEGGRTRGNIMGASTGRKKTIAEEGMFTPTEGGLILMGISDELDLLIANEVRKILVQACQRALMILHEKKGTEMLFTLREALAATKQLNGRALKRVLAKFCLKPEKDFSVWDYNWTAKTNDIYWDEFVSMIWAEDPSNKGFWNLVQEQWADTVQHPTAKVREAQREAAQKAKGEGAVPEIPEWAQEYIRSLPLGGQEEMLMYAPKDVQARIRDGRPAPPVGPNGRTVKLETEVDVNVGVSRADKEGLGPNPDSPNPTP